MTKKRPNPPPASSLASDMPPASSLASDMPPASAAWQRWILTYCVLHLRGERAEHIGEYEPRTHRFRAPNRATAQRFALEHLQHELKNNERLDLVSHDPCRLMAENGSPTDTVWLLLGYHSRGKLLHIKLDLAAACFSRLAPSAAEVHP